MLEGKKIIVVMPAYNAEHTLEQTYRDIPKDLVDEVLVVDDHSRDKTVEVCRKLGLQVFVHEKNRGYGANQKTCYREALKRGADVVIMLHPDYQYPPKLINAMAGLVVSGTRRRPRDFLLRPRAFFRGCSHCAGYEKRRKVF